MECQAVVNSLSDYIDSRDLGLSESEVHDLENHLVGCSKCQRVKVDLAEIKSAACELPLHTPPHTLWTRIANKLEAELPRSERPTRRIESRGVSWWEQVKAIRLTFTLPQFAGALTCVMVLIFLGFFIKTNQARTNLNMTGAQTALLQNEDQIKADLEHKLSAINARKVDWDPQVRAEFEANLGKIEESLNNSRQKLHTNPGDRIQQQMVLTLYNEKRQLLEDMERLKW